MLPKLPSPTFAGPCARALAFGVAVAALTLLLSAPPALAGDPCPALREAFNQRLAAASYQCRADSDCANRPGGVHPSGCGSVVDKASADALYQLYRAFDEACGLDFHCAPEISIPACVDGRCVRSTQAEPHFEIPTAPSQPQAVSVAEPYYPLTYKLDTGTWKPSQTALSHVKGLLKEQVNLLTPCFEAAYPVAAATVAIQAHPADVRASTGALVEVVCHPAGDPAQAAFVVCAEAALAQWRLPANLRKRGLSLQISRIAE